VATYGVWARGSSGADYGAYGFDANTSSQVTELYAASTVGLTVDAATSGIGAINVGIGDTSPNQALDVLSSRAAVTQVTIGNIHASDHDTQIGFELAEGTNTFTLGVDDSDSDKFKISTTALGTNDRLIIDSTGNISVTGQLDAGTSGDGLVTEVSAGACSDTTFTTDTNGLLCIDSTNGRLYFRYGGAWHYAAQTAGFQVPAHETEGLKIGDLVIGKLDAALEDGGLHGTWVKFDAENYLTTQGLKDLALTGTLSVHGNATFLGDVEVKGTLSLSNQQAGFAIIPQGGRQVRVEFEKAFKEKPVVNATADREGITFGTPDVGKEGFTIRLGSPAAHDLTFPGWPWRCLTPKQFVAKQR
jgi:hypothetical protein